MKLLYVPIIILVSMLPAHTQPNLIYYDYMESFNWSGNWWIPSSNSGFFSNISVSSPASAALFGSGNNNYEYDWYVLPSVPLNPIYEHKLTFRLAAQNISGPNASTAGLDVTDFISVQVSTDGGINYTEEIRVTGNSNATWGYDANGYINKLMNGTSATYSPTGGGDRTSTGDGFSTIELTIPVGTDQIAIDIYFRANRSGEDWWIDNIELFELIPQALSNELIESETICQNEELMTLNWTVASEYSVDQYIISTSSDGNAWQQQTTVFTNSSGNSTGIQTYVSNLKINTMDNYYKIDRINTDGMSHTMVFGSIDCNSFKDSGILLYPNPSTSEVYLKINGAKAKLITVTNEMGFELWKTQITPNTVATTLHKNWFGSGIYYVLIEYIDGNHEILPLVFI